MLKDQIRTRLTAARKAGHAVEKEILRVALGEIQTEETRRGNDLDDAAVEKIVRKLVKSNSETLAATEDAARRSTLEEENRVLEALLPKTMGEDEIVAALEPVRAELLGAGNDGQATGIAMKHLKAAGASVDGKTVSAAVRRIRS